MRNIEREMLAAIRERRNFTKDNTQVVWEGNYASVYLHGNEIATIGNNEVVINDCGWQTSTTKSRLNTITYALCKHWVYQRKHKWFTQAEGIDTTPTEIHKGCDVILRRCT